MAKPNSRTTFIDYCLRNLGAPVIEINVDEDQLDDRVDDAIQYYQEYHGDAVVRNIRKHKITNSEIVLAGFTGGVTPAKGDIIFKNTAGLSNPPTKEELIENKIPAAVITEVVSATKFKYDVLLAADTTPFKVGDMLNALSGGTTPNLTFNSQIATLTKGDLENQYIDIPNTFLSVNNVFDIVTQGSSSNMFSVDYQLHLNDIFDLGGPYGGGLVNYEITKQYMSLIQRNINGVFEKIEYSRHKNRVNFHSDETLRNLGVGKFIIFDGHEVIDPDVSTDVWNDRFLKKYATALIKRQWGLNLIKFEGMQLPGGVTLNGRQIFDDAKEEIDKLEEEMILSHEMPPHFVIG